MISESSTGIYMAYPRADEFKVAHTGPGTLVNSRHTKIGLAKVSFHASAERYRRTFDDRIKFIPLVEVLPNRIALVEKELMSALGQRHSRVGAAQNWFDTQDRESMISLIYALFSSSTPGSVFDLGGELEKAG